MIKNQILCLGLSRVELQTLYCKFPMLYQIYQITAEDFDTQEQSRSILSESLCLFINPQKLTVGQLQTILWEHKCATEESHAAILLFTAPFTRDQRYAARTTDLFRVDLRARADRNLRDALELVRKASFPCWNKLNRMEANMFNDGWYLLDLTCSGLDPTSDHIIAIDIAYMANHQLWELETIYIKPPQPLTAEEEAITGITNALLEKGISKEEAVEHLNNLPHPAPFIIDSEKYDYAFLKALYFFCNQKFDHPYIAMEGLLSIVFGYKLCRRKSDLAASLDYRKYPRTKLPDSSISQMYDLILTAFENLEDRYDVRAPGHFHKLYFSDISIDD